MKTFGNITETLNDSPESLQHAGRHFPLPWNPTDFESQNSSE
jgi:hypothetical protein